MLFILAAVLAFFVYIVYEYDSRRKAFALRDQLGIVGPQPDMLTGNIHEIIQYAVENGIASTPKYAMILLKQYGKTYGMYLGKQLLVITSDPSLIRELFITKFSHFTNRQYVTLNGMYPFGDSLLQVGVEGGSHGVGWKEIRSVVSAIFTSGKMKKMHNLFHDQIGSFLECLNEKSKELNGSMDIYGEYQALTMDVIARCAFGLHDISCIRDRNNTFYTRARCFFSNLNFAKSWLIVLSTIFTPLGVFRRFSTWGRAERLIVDDLSVVVTQREQDRAEGKIREIPDLIDLILQENEKRAENGERPMHHDVIVSNCYAFLIAGYETTSTALSYASWLLADNPECQEKLYEEVTEAFGEQGNIDYDRVMKLPYLNGVMLETLRLKPPVVCFTSRECIADSTLGDLKITKGVTVLTPVHVLHVDEEYWQEPFSFLPERFIGEKQPSAPYTYMPFGIGPRNCVGARFAEMEFKTVLAAVVRRFRFEVDPAEPKLQTFISTVLQLPLNSRVDLRVLTR